MAEDRHVNKDGFVRRCAGRCARVFGRHTRIALIVAAALVFVALAIAFTPY